MTPLMGNVSWYVKDCTESAREQILSYSQTSANWENPLSRYNSLQIFVDMFLSCDIKSTKSFVAHRSVSNAVTSYIVEMSLRRFLNVVPAKSTKPDSSLCSTPLLAYQLLSKFTACSWPWPRAYGSHCHSGRFFLPKFSATSTNLSGWYLPSKSCCPISLHPFGRVSGHLSVQCRCTFWFFAGLKHKFWR